MYVQYEKFLAETATGTATATATATQTVERIACRRWLVTMGMQKPAEDRVPEVLAVQKSTPGFRSAHFMRGLGHLTHYLAVRVWEPSIKPGGAVGFRPKSWLCRIQP